jgi:L-ribulokinase
VGKYSIGLDFGTNSVRALLVDCADGREISTSVFNYPTGIAGVIEDSRDPNLARQHPGDYFQGVGQTVQSVLAAASESEPGFTIEDVVGIGTDTTGSSPMPIDANGIPLGLEMDDPAAQCWLWKDHTAYAEAAEITEKAADYPYLSKCGGAYSSEWFWSKILHCARTAPGVFERAHSWCELQDLIPAYLTGNHRPEAMVRGVCAAGHKGMYSREWGGLPSEEFLAKLDPRLASLRSRLYQETQTADRSAGNLSPERSRELGLPENVQVAVGAMDAHLGAVGSGIKPGTLVKIMGTSTCDIMVGDEGVPDIPGVCGIVDGSVLPGMLGIEAGQSAVGDLFNWAAAKLSPGRSHEDLAIEASQSKPGASGLLALDWNNGNRTILVDQRLSGLLIGQSLHTTAAEIYRAMIEATAFGALTIIQRIEEYGVRIDEIVCCGGIADKSPFVMQIYADVCNRPIKLSRSAQTCALGAAIMGSVAGGAHPDVATAVQAMTGTKDQIYTPNPDATRTYGRLFALYRDLHDAFGNTGRTHDLHSVMKELLAIRDSARQA